VHSSGHLFEEVENLAFYRPDLSLDFGKWTGCLIDIKVAIDWDLVTNLGFGKVDPGVGPVRPNFLSEIGLGVGADEVD
jgi:hypothetical protein